MALLSTKIVNFAGMKLNINWKNFLVLFIVIGGIYYICRSFWITAGVLALLLLIDGFLREYDNKKKAERQLKDLSDKLNKPEEEDEP